MENRNRKVEIKSLGKSKFGGLAIYPNTSGVTLTPQLNKAGGYNTGLTKEEEEELEKILNLPKGSLNKKNGDFWHAQEIKVKSKTVLDLSDESQYIKYKWLTASTRVCPSPNDLIKYPQAEYVIVDEETIAKQESKNIDWEIEAFEIFTKLSQEEMRGLLKVFGVKADNASMDMIKTKTHKILKANPEVFIATAKDKNLKTRIIIEDMIDKQIISRWKTFFKNGDEIIASSMEELVEFFNNPKNSAIVAGLKNRLEKTK